MSLLEDRIAEALARAGITQSELARRVGVTRAAIAQWLKGDTLTIEGSNLTKAARALGCNADWLSEGRLPKWDDDAPPGADVIPITAATKIKRQWPFDAPADLWDDLPPAHRRALNGIVTDYLLRNARKRGDSGKRSSKGAAKAQ